MGKIKFTLACGTNTSMSTIDLKGYFTSGKMNVYLTLVIYIVEM